MPDAALTREIAGSTGTDLNSTAFNTRSLTTTTRLRDGQPLVIAGLVSRDISDNQIYTPSLHRIPLLGWVTKSYDKGDSDQELIIIVTPTIVHEPIADLSLWQFPSTSSLLSRAVGAPKLLRNYFGPAKAQHVVE